MNDRPNPLAWWEWLLAAACAIALVGAIVGALGCGPFPTRMKIDPLTMEVTTAEVGYAVPETGYTPITASVDTSGATSVWAWIGGALSVVGGFQFAGPKSWANWIALAKSGVPIGGKGHALAANLGLAHTPAVAKPNVQAADPDRSFP